jgi:membrane-bound lytic murein transglycosylase D
MLALATALLAGGSPAAGPADELDAQIRAILKAFGADTDAVPADFKESVRRRRDALLQRADLHVIWQRKSQYWPMVAKELAARSLPAELGYIALVESHFDPAARGETCAGLWQFQPATARKFGLVIDDSVDERVDPEKSTHEAAQYLATLMGEFGPESFMLALAGYNMGDARVRRGLEQVAREKGGLRNAAHDFWSLYRMNLLTEETRDYVPQVLAAAIVGAHAARYGLE